MNGAARFQNSENLTRNNNPVIYCTDQIPKNDEMFSTSQRFKTKPKYGVTPSNGNQIGTDLEFCDENTNTILRVTGHEMQLSQSSNQMNNPSGDENEDSYITNTDYYPGAVDLK